MADIDAGAPATDRASVGAGGRPSRRPATNQAVALVVAVGFTVAGVAGFVATGLTGWTANPGADSLLGFGLNPLHNAVHLAVGAAGLLLWRRPGGARGYGLLLAVGCTALVVYGLVAVGASWDVLAVNARDTVLHGLAGALGLAVAAWPRHRRGRHRAGPVDEADGSSEAAHAGSAGRSSTPGLT